ncbi:MAG: hypothetical protein H7837_03630 [Magnetococcus sp. MYC-9]
MDITKKTLFPFLQGMGSILAIVPPASYYSVCGRKVNVRIGAGDTVFHAELPADDDFTPLRALATKNPATDWDALYEDWQVVGQDLRNAMDQVRTELSQ